MKSSLLIVVQTFVINYKDEGVFNTYFDSFWVSHLGGLALVGGEDRRGLGGDQNADTFEVRMGRLHR